MASNYTSNYSLCQWAASDKVLRTEFNADNAKIDAAIKAVDSRVDGKASTSALNSLKSTVDGLKTSKADKSAVTSLSSTVTSQGTGLAKRNCFIHLDHYTGDHENVRTFTFPAKPWFVFFFRPDLATVAIRGQSQGYTFGRYASDCKATFQWSGNSVTVTNAVSTMNFEGQAHTIVAFLEP